MEFTEMQTETVEETVDTEVTTEVDLSAFDEGWDDDGYPDDLSYAASEEVEDTSSNKAEADQQEAVVAAEAEATEETERHEDQKTEVADQRFTLKHLDEVREVGRDEVVTLAQKGMDYDRKVTKLNNTIAEYEDFIKEMIGPGNLSIEQFMDSVRAKLLIENEKREGRTLSEHDAIFRVQSARADEAKAEAVQDKPAEADPHNVNEDIRRFVSAYPDVKAESIPQAVWDEVNKGSDLLSAYTRHENAELRQKLKALETNNRNSQRSTGSRKTAGSGATRDAFDEGWDSI